MENKYLNEAIIGNKKMLATYTAKGELLCMMILIMYINNIMIQIPMF